MEIVQLYIRDCVCSETRPVKELRGFRRLPLATAETELVTFTLTRDDLSFLGPDMQPRFEPGDFVLMIGSSSRDRDLLKQQVTLR